MILPISYKANWDAIKLNKQKKIDENCAHENRKRILYTYKPGDQLTVDIKKKIPKLAISRQAPFEVVRAHNNGTVTIRRGPYTED